MDFDMLVDTPCLRKIVLNRIFEFIDVRDVYSLLCVNKKLNSCKPQLLELIPIRKIINRIHEHRLVLDRLGSSKRKFVNEEHNILEHIKVDYFRKAKKTYKRCTSCKCDYEYKVGSPSVCNQCEYNSLKIDRQSVTSRNACKNCGNFVYISDNYDIVLRHKRPKLEKEDLDLCIHCL
jgi:hypothetical protein